MHIVGTQRALITLIQLVLFILPMKGVRVAPMQPQQFISPLFSERELNGGGTEGQRWLASALIGLCGGAEKDELRQALDRKE